MKKLYQMSKLSRFTNMKCPVWIQPVSVDYGFWLYPFTCNNDRVVKLKFLNENQPYNKALEIMAELTSTHGQWCNWEESAYDEYTRIVINIDWWLKKFKPKYLAQYDFFMQSFFKALNKHIRTWKQSGAEYITISDKDINKNCINNYSIPTLFNLEECDYDYSRKHV